MFLMFRPLTFLKIEPAILADQFYALDPGSNLKLCFSPWFLTKAPGTSSFSRSLVPGPCFSPRFRVLAPF